MRNKISILIVTHNSFEKFKQCFKSIKDNLLNREDIFELIIFDNNSDEEILNYLKSIEDENKIKIIYSEKNLGCGGARKRMMEEASGNKILILDSDVVIEDDSFLNKLILKEKENNIGIVGCDGGFVDREKVQFKMCDKNFDGTVDAVCGYCQFFDSKILEKCEIDDYYYPNGEEDFDFCLQIKKEFNKDSYKLSQKDFGLLHDYSYTNRNNLDLRNKNFKYLFKKFNLYEKGFVGVIKFFLKSNTLIRKIDRLIGNINK